MDYFEKIKKVLVLIILMLLSVNVNAQPRGLAMKLGGEPDAMLVVVNKPGELKSKIPEKMVSAIRRLKVEGTLSDDDVRFLKSLAMRSSLKDSLGHRLDPFFDLDLMDANISVGGLFGIRTHMIPDYFLNGSSLLRRIFLPINTERIGEAAFKDCTNLREVHMPMSVNFIGTSAFKGCKALVDVSSPKSLNIIDNGCFEDCQNLQNFMLFDGLVTIGNTAFKNTAITKIRIPDTVRQIGDAAFANTGIESIDIPDGMTEINPRAFEDCKYLQSINVSPQNSNYCNVEGVLFNKQKTVIVRVPVIKSGTYKIPEGVTGIGNYAFSECQKISEVLFPHSLTRIGSGAFRNCKNIGKLELPASLQTLDKAAFAGSGLRSIDISGVKELGGSIFAGCANLTEVKLPMLEQLPTSIFESCTALASIELPKSLKGIGNSSFKDCQNLAKIELPQSLTSIDDDAFTDCRSLQSFEFPQSVTTLGRKTLYGCKNLKSVTCPWQKPLEIKDVINNKTTVLRVPSGTEELYKKAKGWKHFKQIEAF